MKKSKQIVYQIIFVLCALLMAGCAIDSIIFVIKTKTYLHYMQLITYPYPTIGAVVVFIIYAITYIKYRHDQNKNDKDDD